VAPCIFLTGVAAAVAIETCHGFERTNLQRLTEHIVGGSRPLASVASVVPDGAHHRPGTAGAEPEDFNRSRWLRAEQTKVKARLLTGLRLANQQRFKSELGRQIAVDLEADADFDKYWGYPSHVHSPLV
jgi:hypothetical protein